MTLRRCLDMKLLKSIAIATFLVMILVLSGCAKSEPAPAAPAEPAPAAPEEPVAEAPADEGVAEEAAPARTPTAGEGVTMIDESTRRKADYKWEKTDVSAFSNVKCDFGEGDDITISFTVKNENGQVGLGEQDPLAGVAGGQIMVNGKRLKANQVAEACGESALSIEGDASITCSVKSTLRRTALDGTQKIQSVKFSSLDYSTEFRFNCAE